MTPVGETMAVLAEVRRLDYKLLSSLDSGVASRMIIVHGFVSYRVACRERAMQVFHEIAKTARSEPGCLRYDVFLADRKSVV